MQAQQYHDTSLDKTWVRDLQVVTNPSHNVEQTLYSRTNTARKTQACLRGRDPCFGEPALEDTICHPGFTLSSQAAATTALNYTP
jgi:hypothetical protein